MRTGHKGRVHIQMAGIFSIREEMLFDEAGEHKTRRIWALCSCWSGRQMHLQPPNVPR